MRVVLLQLTLSLSAHAVDIRTLPIGNPGNSPDPLTSHGAVSYDYRIGATEVTNAQYVEFLNAVAATDTYELYNGRMWTNRRAGIMRTGSPGSYVYSVKADASSYSYANKPVIYVSWADAARFANWLHNGQPSGPQSDRTTEDGAYTLNGAMSTADMNAVVRERDATWFIPSQDEWYKAAYYDGDSSNYYLYPIGSNSMPNNKPPELDTGVSANYYRYSYYTLSSAYPLSDAGAYPLSVSPYGTHDQAGNVWEWNEAVIDERFREFRGGSFDHNEFNLQSLFSNYAGSDLENDSIGFRVATVPEPGTLLMGAIGMMTLIQWSRRRR